MSSGDVVIKCTNTDPQIQTTGPLQLNSLEILGYARLQNLTLFDVQILRADELTFVCYIILDVKKTFLSRVLIDGMITCIAGVIFFRPEIC